MADRSAPDARRRAVRGSLVALALAVAAGAWLAAWPCFYVGQRPTPAGSPASTTRLCGGSLIGENGLWVVWLLLIPVALAGVAWLGAVSGRRVPLWGAGIVSLGFCVLAVFSIGVFYLPTAVALLVTAAIARRGTTGDRGPSSGSVRRG
ncbi:MAG: hypothetical protein ACE14W_09900 [Candidatus Velamenicoccus archaeovorus]